MAGTLVIKSAPDFGLSELDARAIIKVQIEAIQDLFPELAKDVDLSDQDYTLLRERAILREYAFEGY